MGDGVRAHVEDHVRRCELAAARLAGQPGGEAPRTDPSAAGGPHLPWPRLDALSAAAGLGPVQTALLSLAVATEIDDRLPPLLARLHGDRLARVPTVGLALRLLGRDPLDPQLRAALGPDGPLTTRLLLLEDRGPLLGARLVARTRVVEHLLGADPPGAPGTSALPGAVPEPLGLPHPGADRLARALSLGSPLGYVLQQVPGLGDAVAVAALSRSVATPLQLSLDRLPADVELMVVLRQWVLECQLQALPLVVGPVDAHSHELPEAVDLLHRSGTRAVLHGSLAWDQRWGVVRPSSVEVGRPSAGDLARLADAAVAALPATSDERAALRRAVEQLAHRKWAGVDVRAALEDALLTADEEGVPPDQRHLAHALSAQQAPRLGELSERSTPTAGLDALVLPAPQRRQLEGLIDRVRVRHGLGESGVGGTGGPRPGVSALLVGPPGTGKTSSASAVAYELSLDLCTVQLATVVDKYIGETQKKLERVLTAAEGGDVVLFFDEADALFGRRSDVGDAKDRYANLEVAYLLQRLERFEGVVLLATNLFGNLDKAFLRRFDAVVQVPLPGPAERRALWVLALGEQLERDPDVAAWLDEHGGEYELSGGEIHNIVINAAVAPVLDGRPLGAQDLSSSLAAELLKAGRLLPAPLAGTPTARRGGDADLLP